MRHIIGRFLGRQEQPAEGSSADSMTPDQYFAGDEAWIPVAVSSNVHSISFFGQGDHGIVGVRFLDKKTGGYSSEYRYDNVGIYVWEAFLNAPSKGHFVHSSLKDRYLTVGPL